MVTDDHIIGLERAYALLQSLHVIHEYGPLRAYKEHETALHLWRETIDPAVALVHGNEHRTADGTYAAEAPSPWHAYFYLRAQHQYVYRSGSPLGAAPAIHETKTVGEHMFFRGQRCAGWEFKSSLRRNDEVTQRIEQRSVAALAEYFRLMFVSDDNITNNTARCFAQHYGIATDLADISCDPDIAVWFATHPVGKPCPSGEGDGVVRAVSWAAQQKGSETVFLLPPPFVRNVYRQRGLFIDTSGTEGLLKGSLAMEVRFPRNTAGGEFEVIRDNTSVAVWPDPDESELELVSWAKTVGAECTNDDAVRTRVQMQRSEGALPNFWLNRELYEFEKHLTAWLSILDWVLPATCVTALPVAGPQPIRYEVNGLKVRALVRANPSFFRAFVGASKGADFSAFEVLKQVLRIAGDEIGA